MTASRSAPPPGGQATEVFTDGACRGNPGPGGWAWAVAPSGEPHGSGGEPHSTNQRMEIRAALEALRSNAGRIEVVSDSTYVVNCINQRWYANWRKNGWRNSQRKPVANDDLWKPMIELYLQRRDEVTFRWVKGHSGDPMNDLVDRLAVAASSGPFDPEIDAPPTRPATTAAPNTLFDD